MPKSAARFESEHAAFQKRLQAIHASPIGIAAQDAMNALLAAYREAALEHWRELGNRASTGWGQPPEADFQKPHTADVCADWIARTLAGYFSSDPNDPPGSGNKDANT